MAQISVSCHVLYRFCWPHANRRKPYVFRQHVESVLCIDAHGWCCSPGVVPAKPRSWPTACACGRNGAAGGNYCNLSTAGAGGICRGTINARSRWLWAGDEWMGASRVKKHRERERNEGSEAVRWSAECSHTWIDRSCDGVCLCMYVCVICHSSHTS